MSDPEHKPRMFTLEEFNSAMASARRDGENRAAKRVTELEAEIAELKRTPAVSAMTEAEWSAFADGVMDDEQWEAFTRENAPRPTNAERMRADARWNRSK